MFKKNENRPIFVTLHKAQVQVNQGPQYKTRYTESNIRESGKEANYQNPKQPNQKWGIFTQWNTTQLLKTMNL